LEFAAEYATAKDPVAFMKVFHQEAVHSVPTLRLAARLAARNHLPEQALIYLDIIHKGSDSLQRVDHDDVFERTELLCEIEGCRRAENSLVAFFHSRAVPQKFELYKVAKLLEQIKSTIGLSPEGARNLENIKKSLGASFQNPPPLPDLCSTLK
jgi:hypothetical protein